MSRWLSLLSRIFTETYCPLWRICFDGLLMAWWKASDDCCCVFYTCMHTCRHLSSKLFATKADFNPMYDFLSSLHFNGMPLMLNDRVSSFEEMDTALTKAEKLLENMESEVCAHGCSPLC